MTQYLLLKSRYQQTAKKSLESEPDQEKEPELDMRRRRKRHVKSTIVHKQKMSIQMNVMRNGHLQANMGWVAYILQLLPSLCYIWDKDDDK